MTDGLLSSATNSAGRSQVTMTTCENRRLVLVAAAVGADVRAIELALDRLGVDRVRVYDAVEAMRAICHERTAYSAVVVGEGVGQASGLTVCGLARDAGCSLPMLLTTADDCRRTAMRAARLEVTVLWLPASARHVARTVDGMLPRRCGCPTGRVTGRSPGVPSTTRRQRALRAGGPGGGPWRYRGWPDGASWRSGSGG